jgi:hypothetical protein
LEPSYQTKRDGNAKRKVENFECHTLFERQRRFVGVIGMVLETIGCDGLNWI